MISKSNIYIFFKDFTNNRKKTSRAITFCSEPCPDILNYGEQKSEFPTIWRTRLLHRHIEKFS